MHGHGASAWHLAALRDEQFVAAVHVRPVQAERRAVVAIEHATLFAAPPALGQIGEHDLPVVDGIRVGRHASALPVGVNAHGLRPTQRRELPRAGGLFASLAQVEAHQLARLERVVARGDAEEQRGARHGARVDERGGEPGVAAVDGPLVRAVHVHAEERLRVHLRAVVVFPARVEDAAVRRERGVVVVDLVEGDAPDVRAVRLAPVEVAHLGPPAVDDLHAARGVEEDASVGQVAALVVGDPLAKGQLARLLAREVVLPEVEVVAAVARLEGVEEARAVGRHVHVAETPFLRFEQDGLAPEAVRGVLGQAEARSDRQVRALVLRVGKRLRVGVVRAAHHVVAAVGPATREVRDALQPLRAARQAVLPVFSLGLPLRQSAVLPQPVFHQLVRRRRAVQRHARKDCRCKHVQKSTQATPLNMFTCLHGTSIAHSLARPYRKVNT